MAERIEAMPARTRRPQWHYPWDEWLDGSAWELIRGKDFEVEPNIMRGNAISAANARQLRIEVFISGDRVYIQAQR